MIHHYHILSSHTFALKTSYKHLTAEIDNCNVSQYDSVTYLLSCFYEIINTGKLSQKEANALSASQRK